MVAFISKKVLRLGFYEVSEDIEELEEDNLVQFDVDKTMRTIYSALMASATKSDGFTQARRAITILSSFQEEVKAEMMSPPLNVDIKFNLSGRIVEYNLIVCELTGAIEMLNNFITILEQIKGIEDVPHAEIFQ